MRYYPVCLDLHKKSCLVVGGGEVAQRKVDRLLRCGARVTVVALSAAPALRQLAGTERIVLKLRSFRPSDLEGHFLVIGATNDEALNRRISREAERLNILCNIVDRPDCCNFILPSVVTQGDLMVAISTSAKSPALAKHLRRDLEKRFDPAYARFLTLMGRIRQRLLLQTHAPEAHKPLFEQLIHSDLLDKIRQNDIPAIDSILKTVIGKEFSYAGLIGVTPTEQAASFDEGTS